jgi:uncharacterized membrane protein
MSLIGFVSTQQSFGEAQELSLQKSVTIDAPADVVWKLIGDFNGINKWHPLLRQSRIILGENNRVGCIRELVRASGTKINEKLINYDAAGMSLEYTAVSGVTIATDYFAIMSVRPADNDANKSVVVWQGRYKRKAYWTDEPPEGQDDKFSTELLTRAFTVGLDALKAKLEGGQ